MTILQSIILGVIQGITEFLPISSSGHLVLAPYLLGWEIPEEQVFVFDVLVQMGTLFAVLLYFRHDVWQISSAVLQGIREKRPFENPDSQMGWLLLLATIPAGAVGLLANKLVRSTFMSIPATALFLLLTAGIIIISERVGSGKKKHDEVSWVDAIWIGLFQILALFPGVSRSGSTIAGGITRNLTRTAAARFSFLMAFPIMFSAGIYSAIDLLGVENLTAFLPSLGLGLLTSAITGYYSIRWLLRYLTNHTMYVFAIYLIGLSFFTLITLYFPR